LNGLGYAEDTTIQLIGGGSHNLAANYGGDNSYNGSTHTQGITITKAATYIGNLAAPGSAAMGQTFTVTATVWSASYGLAPSGTVTFLRMEIRWLAQFS
jgi:hypothetical protein